MTATPAFIARTRLPDAEPATLPFRPAPRTATSVDLAPEYPKRRFEVEYKPDLRPYSRLDWRVRFYGAGVWTRCEGHEHAFSTREAADEAGRVWVETGRTA